MKPIPPKRVAKAIADAVLKGKDRVYAPGYTALLRIPGPHLFPLG